MNMFKTFNTVNTFSLLAILCLCSCSKSPPKLEGTWIASPSETMKVNENYMKSNSKNKFNVEMTIQMMKKKPIRLVFDKDQVTYQNLFETSIRKFKIISSSGGEVKIECYGNETDIKRNWLLGATFRFLSADKMLLPKEGMTVKSFTDNSTQNISSFDIVFEKSK